MWQLQSTALDEAIRLCMRAKKHSKAQALVAEKRQKLANIEQARHMLPCLQNEIYSIDEGTEASYNYMSQNDCADNQTASHPWLTTQMSFLEEAMDRLKSDAESMGNCSNAAFQQGAEAVQL